MQQSVSRILTAALKASLCTVPALAQQQERPHAKVDPKYEVRLEESVMVSMRDRTRLSTDLYWPEGVSGKLPAILIRTPYNKNYSRDPKSAARFFAGQGYVVAVQDVRGKFESEGDYIISAADTNDGYDMVSWMAKQPWSNEKIGTYGCSYSGENQMEMAKLRHPNHAAMIPMASGGAWRYFGLIQGGVFELAAGSDWFLRSGSKINPKLPANVAREEFLGAARNFNLAPVEKQVDYRRLWRTLPTIDMLKSVGAPPTDFEDAISHGPADPWWDRLGYLKKTDRFDTPALFLDSWYDYGAADTLAMWNLLQKNSESPRARENQFAIIAPTTHCVYARETEQTVVGQRFVGDARLDFYGIYLRWFDYWLKGIDNGVTELPKIQIFVMGKNQWRGENEWPLSRTELTKFYLHSGGRANGRFGDGTLSTSPPADQPSDELTYDPRTPVPSAGGPDFGASLPEFPPGAMDQSEVEMRHDVLVYTTPVLEHGIEVTGQLEVVLQVSSSAKDTDFTAKLVDVYPDGTAFNVQDGVLRMRYREGFDKRVWMEPGRVVEAHIDLHATSNYFPAGHRIRLEVSSSNFPRFERNLNTGGENYDEAEGVVAKNTVHHSTKYPSYLLLPVIPE